MQLLRTAVVSPARHSHTTTTFVCSVAAAPPVLLGRRQSAPMSPSPQLDRLPADILDIIASLLQLKWKVLEATSQQDLLALSETCKVLHQASTKHLWRVASYDVQRQLKRRDIYQPDGLPRWDNLREGTRSLIR